MIRRASPETRAIQRSVEIASGSEYEFIPDPQQTFEVTIGGTPLVVSPYESPAQGPYGADGTMTPGKVGYTLNLKDSPTRAIDMRIGSPGIPTDTNFVATFNRRDGMVLDGGSMRIDAELAGTVLAISDALRGDMRVSESSVVHMLFAQDRFLVVNGGSNPVRFTSNPKN